VDLSDFRIRPKVELDEQGFVLPIVANKPVVEGGWNVSTWAWAAGRSHSCLNAVLTYFENQQTNSTNSTRNSEGPEIARKKINPTGYKELPFIIARKRCPDRHKDSDVTNLLPLGCVCVHAFYVLDMFFFMVALPGPESGPHVLYDTLVEISWAEPKPSREKNLPLKGA